MLNKTIDFVLITFTFTAKKKNKKIKKLHLKQVAISSIELGFHWFDVRPRRHFACSKENWLENTER